MQVIHLLIPPDGVHIRVDSLIYAIAIAPQRHALPFGQGVDDLHLLARILQIELHRPLHAVQIVIQSAIRPHKKRRRNAMQIQRRRQFALESVFDQFNCLFRLANIELRIIVFGKNQPSFLLHLYLFLQFSKLFI